jgi:hypothetical protein
MGFLGVYANASSFPRAVESSSWTDPVRRPDYRGSYVPMRRVDTCTLTRATAFVMLIFVQPQTSSTVPFLGVWKLNAAKSNYGTFTVPKSVTLVVEDRGNGFFKQSNTGQPADGPGGIEEQTLKCDGQDYAYRSDIQYSNFPNVSTTRYVSCTKRSATTFEFTLRDESKRVLSLSTRTMSPDGTSFTETHKWLYRGRPVTTITVNGRTMVAPVAVFEIAKR